MLSAYWESSTGALVALLNGGADPGLVICDLYTITLLGGQVLRYTDSDTGKTVGSRTFTVGPLLSRDRVRRGIGISVDTMTVRLSARPTLLVNGSPMIEFITRGGFADARIQVERLYAGSNGVPVGSVIKFTGRVGEVTGPRFQKTIEVKSDTELLDVLVPREVFQPPCKNDLFKPLCALDAASYLVNGTSSSATDAPRTSITHVLGYTAGYFNLGVITFTSGLNVGISRTVRLHTSTVLTVARPWPFAIAAGDTFSVLPGCDKTQATCKTKFNNLPHFRGEPYIPAPETVI